MTFFDEAVAALRPLDGEAARQAAEHHDRLTKPRGALGRLESLGVQLAGIAGVSPPPVPEPATGVFVSCGLLLSALRRKYLLPARHRRTIAAVGTAGLVME